MHNQSFIILQKKALTLIHFKEHNTHMVKLPDKIKFQNCLFIRKHINNKLPPIFNCSFTFYALFITMKLHLQDHLKIPTVTTTTYGK